MNGRLWNKGRFAATAVAVLGTFLIFAALVWAMKKYTQQPPLDEDRVAIRKKALTEMHAAEIEQLSRYGWINQSKGVVRLPIEEAMKLTSSEWQNPTQARSNLVARMERATAPPPKPLEKPSPYE